MLSRGFQELARSVRNALEQAHLYLTVTDFSAAGKSRNGVTSKLQSGGTERGTEAKFSRPLGGSEQTPLASAAFREGVPLLPEGPHRAGMVTPVDADASGNLVLSLSSPDHLLWQSRLGD